MHVSKTHPFLENVVARLFCDIAAAWRPRADAKRHFIGAARSFCTVPRRTGKISG
jgi:hypothetical protein